MMNLELPVNRDKNYTESKKMEKLPKLYCMETDIFLDSLCIFIIIK